MVNQDQICSAFPIELSKQPKIPPIIIRLASPSARDADRENSMTSDVPLLTSGPPDADSSDGDEFSSETSEEEEGDDDDEAQEQEEDQGIPFIFSKFTHRRTHKPTPAHEVSSETHLEV